jgi:hypothetical protein
MAAASAALLRGPHPDTPPFVLPVMPMISGVKGITLVEEMALSHKTRIAAVVAGDAIKSRVMVFDRRSTIRASTLQTQEPVGIATDRVLARISHQMEEPSLDLRIHKAFCSVGNTQGYSTSSQNAL